MVLTADLRVRANRYLSRASDAARVALSGLELARVRLGDDRFFDGGNYAIGTDGDVTSNVSITTEKLSDYRIRVATSGAQGDSTQSVLAELKAPSKQVLDFNIVSAGSVTFVDTTIGGHVRANGSVTTSGNVDFSGTIETLTGSTVSSSFVAGQVAYVSESLPPPALSLTTLENFCSPIVGAPLSNDRSTIQLHSFRLSPSYNPWGNTNARGAYVLDADQKNVSIQDGFVRGMLLILNAGTVTVEHGYSHWRQDASLPTLVVQGNLDLKLELSMSEAATLTDLNGDGDLLDLFEPRLDGIVQATGELTLPYGGTLSGCALGNSVKLVGYSTVLKCAELDAEPVHEYTEAGAWEIVAGSVEEGS